MKLVVSLMAVGTLTLLTAASARAHEGEPRAPIAQKQVVSASPILWTAGWFHLDYERRVSPTVTFGASGSYLPAGDYGRATLHARYYPQHAALTGFYVGVQTGVHAGYLAELRNQPDHTVRVGAGWDVGYAVISGRVAVSLGFGTTRVFGVDRRYSSAIANGRLVNVGIAF